MQRYEGRPFAWLGVNSDPDRRVLQQVVAAKGIPGRSWWDGGAPSGPIATRYHVRVWPTIYVIDPNGIIRYIQVRDHALDEAVETLLREAETKRVAGK